MEILPASETDVKAQQPKTENSPSLGMATFKSAPNYLLHNDFFQKVQEILLNHVFRGASRHEPVTNWEDPADLAELVDLEVGRSPNSHETLIELLKDTIKYSVKTGHPYFMNQLFSGVDPYGLVGEWLTAVLNPSAYTYEVAPLVTLMEDNILAEMRSIIGWDDGDGTFCPGGSLANGFAISCARYFKFPQVKNEGVYALPKLVLFTSEDAHYSITKMASFEGLGANNVLKVRTDRRGKMDVRHLEELVEKTIARGAFPFMVSATAGTTVLGAYDPLGPISEVCEKYGMWLHVDAAWGGGALMSKKHRALLSGIERADSVTWNPHKMLAAPQQCSTFHTKHKDVLSDAHSARAQYLFQKDKFYDTRYDTGDKHIQCGRRADVLKFWFMWKAKGTNGFEQHVDRLFENAYYFTESLRNRPGFELVLQEPECTNVTFWYIPPSLRGRQHEPDYNSRLHKVAPLIKERMMREGTMMITYQPQRELPNFFRLVLQNSVLDKTDMDHIVCEIERLGRDL